MDAKLSEANLTCKVDVAEIEYTEPLGNGLRVFCGRIVNNPQAYIRIQKGSKYQLTLDGRVHTVQIIDEDDAGFYFSGALK